MIRPNNYGALSADWAHFDVWLGLTADLLPVLELNAKISSLSSMKALGKTPSIYNAQGLVVGIRNWTQRVTTSEEIAEWEKEPDYGICIQTRRLRAIDIDVDDPERAQEITASLEKNMGVKTWRRWRENSGKCLLAFMCPVLLQACLQGEGRWSGRVSGDRPAVRRRGDAPLGCPVSVGLGVTAMPPLPERFLEISGEQWEAAHDGLFAVFGVPGTDHRASGRKGALGDEDLDMDDPVADYLAEHGDVIGAEHGKVFVTCPFKHEHSDPDADNPTEAAWLVAGTNGYARGHFQCFHASCRGRTDADFLNAVGFRAATAEDFEDLTTEPAVGSRRRFHLHTFAELKAQPPPKWFIKGVLPKAGLGVLYGETGGGKTFFTMDAVAHIAAGRPWRGHKVKQASVAYVCAEGAGGFRNRMMALEKAFGDGLPLRVIIDVPNFPKDDDDKELAAEINSSGGAELIVIDTLAQTTPGANENSSEDMGAALARCHRLAAKTGATVLLVHHAGVLWPLKCIVAW